MTGCASILNPAEEVPKNVVVKTASGEIANQALLNISIQRFSPGKLPEDKEDRRGLTQQIRDAESRYMPIHLKYTLQRSGYWGNVRVVPDENIGSDVLVQGEIMHSDGESIEVKIKVKDALNQLWFEKLYQETVVYSDNVITEQEKKDIFQNLYNQITNDIIEYREKLTTEQVGHIQQASELRFAQFMAPDVFSGYLNETKDGQINIVRLPSVNDPMMQRVKLVRSRDELLVDTINNYYDIYYSDMWESYENWRKFRSEELETIREIERKALTQKLLGAAAIIGAIALGASSNEDVRDRTGVLRTVMVAGGAYGLYSGFKTSKETEINKEAVEELGASFTTEVEPMTVEVKGKAVKLTGSAEQQYTKWRGLLTKIYKKETGFD
jgi:hypothetical protein